MARARAPGQNTRNAHRIVINMAVGAPDYYQYVKPMRTILAPGQTRYITYATVVVAADGGFSELIIQPDSGYDLYGSMVIVSSAKSCIQKCLLKMNDTVFGQFDFDIVKVIPFPAEAAQLIHDDEYFRVRITNNADETSRVSITIMGTIVQVG